MALVRVKNVTDKVVGGNFFGVGEVKIPAGAIKEVESVMVDVINGRAMGKGPLQPCDDVLDPEEVLTQDDNENDIEDSTELADMSYDDLKALADEREITYKGNISKAALIELLEV